VDEGGMDHAVSGGRAAAQAVEIVERSTMHASAQGRERGGCFIGAGKAGHLVTGGDQGMDNGRADEAGGAGHENIHGNLLGLDGG
jgi:hypothetical protein